MRDIDRYESEYIRPDFESYLVRQRRKKVLESIYGKRNILEIGCGMEPLFMYMEWGGIQKVTIFEPGERFAQNASTLSHQTDISIEVINKPFSLDVFSGESPYFDAIVCSGLLHEVENPEHILRDIYKISSDETIIHVNVPNADSFHRVLAKEIGLINDEKEASERNIRLQQHRVFNMDDLAAMCNDCGLNVLERGSYFIKPFTHDQMKKMMDYEILNEDILDGLYLMTSKYFPKYGCEIFANCRRK